jgi:uncharacterized membrane protein
MNFRANIVYGLLVLAPLGIVVLVLAKGVEILRAISEPLAAVLGMESGVFVGASAVVIAALVLVIFCYLVGSFVRTSVGSWSFEKLEKTLLKEIPGYQIIGNVLKGFAGEDVAQYRAARIDLYGTGSAVLGFVMEELASGEIVVFVPLAPTLTIGAVHVVAADRVRLLESAMEVTQSISRWGVGSRRALEGVPNESGAGT